jgi:hypothetical protein
MQFHHPGKMAIIMAFTLGDIYEHYALVIPVAVD